MTTLTEERTYVREARLPQEDEVLEIGRRFGELDTLIFHLVRNLEDLVERWGEGNRCAVSYDDVGRLAVFADNLKLDLAMLSDGYVKRVHEALDEVMMQARDTATNATS